jgi:hypothetical protein
MMEAARMARPRSLTVEDLHADLLPDDEWPWRVGPFEALGQLFEVRTTDRRLAELVEATYACMAAEKRVGATLYSARAPTAARVGAVHRDTELIGTGWRPSTVLDHLVWAINRQVIERSLGRLVLHAAAAAMDEAVVLLPAPMEAGKTTLVTALLDCGLSYLTDEAAAIDADLVVQGFPKPLSIDPGSWEVLAHHRPADADDPYLAQQWQVAAETIATIRRSGRLTLVVLPRYDPAAAPRYAQVPASDAFAALVPCTFAPPDTSLPAEKVRLLARISRGTTVVRLVYHDLPAACELILGTLAEQAIRAGR